MKRYRIKIYGKAGKGEAGIFCRFIFRIDDAERDNFLRAEATREGKSMAMGNEEAQSFIEDMVKPDYNSWEGKEDYEQRFIEIIEKKFA